MQTARKKKHGLATVKHAQLC